MVTIDEIQDIDIDFVPVILECAATFPTNKIVMFCGTPKTLDNGIEYYWSKESTMCEWMVKCTACGKWNGTGISNIGTIKKGYVCAGCSTSLDIRLGQWVQGKSNATYAGYHINQIMTPYTHKDWGELHRKYREYSLAKFMNEVLGESFDSGVKPITRDQLLKCCRDYRFVENPPIKTSRSLTVAGIDWGTGELSFTVLVIMSILPNNTYKVEYAKRYQGVEANQDTMLAHILGMLNKYNCNKVGVDHGFGYYFNYALQRDLQQGMSRVVPIFYSPALKRKLQWHRGGKTMIAARTMVMEDVFQLMKRQEIVFPVESQWMDPFGEDILNEFVEERAKQTRLVYTHPPNKPDDTLHALVYGVIAAQFLRPRTDLFSPQQWADDILGG
jgi:hypothetical protein